MELLEAFDPILVFWPEKCRQIITDQCLTNQEVAIVSSEPGTTTDPVLNLWNSCLWTGGFYRYCWIG